MKTDPSLRAARQFLMACLIAVPALVSAQLQTADQSCPPPPRPLEQQMAYISNAPAKNAGFLWRIEKDGRTSWLYGTMHLNHIDFAKPGLQIMMGMRSSDVLAVEINLHEPQNLPASFKAPEFQWSSRQIERLKKAYVNDCLTTDVHAVTAASGLIPLLNTQGQRQGLSSAFSPDSRLAQIAKRTGKTIVPLETIEQQIMALAPTSQTEFEQSVDVLLNDIESGKMQTDLVQLNKAWQQNDLQTMVKLEQDITRDQPDFARRILDERNKLMAQKIDALHRDGKRAFVAVGVLHMVGKTALPQLMQDKGYVVTYVPLRN